MNEALHHRILTAKDRLQKGDRILDPEENRWVPVRKEWIGEFFDPQGHNVTIRPFYLPANEQPKDKDPKEEVKKKFDFRKIEKPCIRVLIGRMDGGAVAIRIYKDEFSPSKNWVFLKTVDDKDFGWMAVDAVEKSAIEIL